MQKFDSSYDTKFVVYSGKYSIDEFMLLFNIFIGLLIIVSNTMETKYPV